MSRLFAVCGLAVILASAAVGCTPASNSSEPARPAGTTTTSETTTPSAAEQPHTPAAGSKERKAVLAALRTPVERDLAQPVTFKINRIRVQGDFAFVDAVPRKKNGKAINYKKTRYASLVNAGTFDDGIVALLKRNSTSGWFVQIYAVGATDAPQVAWPQQYGAPPALVEP